MTHMDKKIFPDPNKFNPLRFEQLKAPPPYSFVAFGGGARRCPGKELARIETLVMIHYLMKSGFKWKLKVCGEGHDFFYRDPMPVFNQGLPIKLEHNKTLAF